MRLILSLLVAVLASSPSSAVSRGIQSAIPLPAQQGREAGQYTIAVDIDLAQFNVAVTDNKGRHIAGLIPSDFKVYEDGVLQDITLFDPGDVSAGIGLIIDNSGSMRAKRDNVIEAALGFVKASNPDDEIFVVNFNENVRMGLPPGLAFTSSREQIRSALVQSRPEGLTALYDAVAQGLDHLKSSQRDRKAIVVVSDGGDNSSRSSLAQALQLAQRSSATIYTIGIYDVDDMDKNPGVLRRLAQVTGGSAYFPQTPADLDKVWRDIADGIRSQYTIGYVSENHTRNGKERKVKVVVSDSKGTGFKVHAREGYLAPNK